jgi:hypothetical protein
MLEGKELPLNLHEKEDVPSKKDVLSKQDVFQQQQAGSPHLAV